jgi:CheY-like chemotaxis protein
MQLVKVEGNEYDIIFVDQYMASTTKQLLGTETTRELRAKGCQSVICTFFVLFLPSVSRVEPLIYFNLFCFFIFFPPIVGLSANDLESQFLEAGGDGFIMKVG